MMESTGHYKLKMGDKALPFLLKGTDGKKHQLSDFKHDLLVLWFSCNHCPYAQAYEERMMALVKEFEEQADFVAINANDDAGYPEDSFEKMVERAKARRFNFTYLRDETQEVAHAYGGECTPHAFLFGKDRTLRYQGRVDDNWREPGKVTKRELRDAILAVLAGRKPPVELTNAIGCSIKWKATLP